MTASQKGAAKGRNELSVPKKAGKSSTGGVSPVAESVRKWAATRGKKSPVDTAEGGSGQP